MALGKGYFLFDTLNVGLGEGSPTIMGKYITNLFGMIYKFLVKKLANDLQFWQKTFIWEG